MNGTTTGKRWWGTRCREGALCLQAAPLRRYPLFITAGGLAWRMLVGGERPAKPPRVVAFLVG